MSGNKVAVFDSNIFIYLSKGQLDFSAIATRYNKIYVSVVTYMEVLGFNFPNPAEETLLINLFQQFEIVHTDTDLAKQVVAYRKLKKIKIPDAIILATADKLGAELVTVNESDFKGIDNSVALFKPDLI